MKQLDVGGRKKTKMQKAKQLLIKLALLTISLVGVVLSVSTPAMAAAFDIWRFIAGIGQTLLDLVFNLLNIVLGLLAWISTALGKLLLSAVFNTDTNFLLNTSVTSDIWHKILLITNSIYLFALILASIAIILRISLGSYNIKKVLGSLVTAVFLSNISLLVVKTLVELGDQLTTSLVQLFGSGLDYKQFLFRLLDETQPIKAIGNQTEEIIITWIVFIVIVIAIIKLALILFQRMIWLFGLAVLAPLAFAVSMLPNMAEYSKKWWESTIKWVLILPATVGLISLSILIMSNGKNDMDAIIYNINNLSSLYQKNAAGLITINDDLIMIIAGIAVMWIASEASKYIKLPSADVGGKVYQSAANLVTGKSAAGKWIGSRGKDIYNLGMGNEKIRQWEAKRRATTTPVWGRLFNREGFKAKTTADRKLAQDKALVGEYAKQADTINNQLEKEKDPQKREKLTNRLKDVRGSLEYFMRKANEDTPPDAIPNIQDLQKDIQEALKDLNDPKQAKNKMKNYGKLALNIHLMRKLSRAKNIRPDEAQTAKGFLNSDEGQNAVKQAGVKESLYKPPLRTAQRPVEVPLTTTSTNTNELLAQNKNTKRTQTESLQDSLKKLNLSKNIDVAHLEKIRQLTSFQDTVNNSGDPQKIEAFNSVKEARQNVADPNNNEEMIRWLSQNKKIPYELDNLPGIRLYIDTNDQLNAIGANVEVIKDLNSLDSGKGTKSITDIINEIENKINDLQQTDQVINNLELDIKRDDDNSLPAYQNNLKIHIENKAKAENRSTLSVQQDIINELTNINQIIDSDFEKGEKSATPAKTTTLGVSGQFNQFKELIEKTNIGSANFPSKDALENANLGEVKTIARKALHALKNPPKPKGPTKLSPSKRI